MKISSRTIFSKRHHYLPIFYLKGFCNTDGLFYVFDKIIDDFLPISTPDSKFYCNNLNNYLFNGKPLFSYEEKFYTPMDTKNARNLRKLLEFDLNGKESIPPEIIFELMWFISNLFWRSPNTNSIFKELIIKEGLCNSDFGFYNKNTGKKLSDTDIPDIKSQLISNKELQKAFKIIIPFSNSNFKEMWKLIQNYSIYFVNDSSMICGDSPIICKPHEIGLNNLFDEMIFPLSNNRLIIFGKKTPKFFDLGLFKNYINLGVLFSSKRYICSDCKSKIFETLKYRDILTKQGKYSEVLTDLFKIKDIQSNFKDFEKYVEFYNSLKNT